VGVSSAVEYEKHNQKAFADVAFIRELTCTFIRECNWNLKQEKLTSDGRPPARCARFLLFEKFEWSAEVDNVLSR
jgi:hypothetical protein